MALIVGLLFMANAAILIKVADAPGIVTVFYRMFFGSVTLFLPFIIYLKRSKQKLPRKGVLLAIFAGSCFGFDMALWSTGVVASNATLPTITANMAPLWVGIGSIFIFKEKHGSGFWIGILLALSGATIMLSKDFMASNGIIEGASLGVLAGIFYGAFYLISQKGRSLVSTLPYLFISTTSSAFVLFILMLIKDYPFVGYPKETWIYLILFGIGVQVIGWYLINYSQGFIPASIVSPTLLGQPVITAIMATTLLKEDLSFIHWLGGGIVVLGIYVVHFSRKK